MRNPRRILENCSIIAYRGFAWDSLSYDPITYVADRQMLEHSRNNDGFVNVYTAEAQPLALPRTDSMAHQERKIVRYSVGFFVLSAASIETGWSDRQADTPL